MNATNIRRLGLLTLAATSALIFANANASYAADKVSVAVIPIADAQDAQSGTLSMRASSPRAHK